MSTAIEKFKEDQRVKMTEEGIARGIDGYHVKRRKGIVKGFPTYAPVGDHTKLVYVRRDGERSRKTYHMDFWEPDESEDTK